MNLFYVDQLDPVDEDEQSLGKQRSSLHFRNNSEEELVAENTVESNRFDIDSTAVKPDVYEQETAVAIDQPSRSEFSRKLTNLEIPKRDDLLVKMHSESLALQSTVDNLHMEDGYDSASEQDEQAEKHEGIEEDDEEEIEVIPAESILQRINSHKEMKSYQLGKQLSCKWTTGAGPRIGCVRDYPSGLQFRALEQVSLSPRSACALTKSVFSPGYVSGSYPKASTPIQILSRKSIGHGHCSVQLSPLSIKGRKPTL